MRHSGRSAVFIRNGTTAGLKSRPRRAIARIPLAPRALLVERFRIDPGFADAAAEDAASGVLRVEPLRTCRGITDLADAVRFLAAEVGVHMCKAVTPRVGHARVGAKQTPAPRGLRFLGRCHAFAHRYLLSLKQFKRALWRRSAAVRVSGGPAWGRGRDFAHWMQRKGWRASERGLRASFYSGAWSAPTFSLRLPEEGDSLSIYL